MDFAKGVESKADDMTTTTRLRVNLERLLLSCERMTEGSDLHCKGGRRRFETYLSVLQRYWHELAKESDEGLAEYRRKIEYLADLIDESKLRSGSMVSQSQAHNQPELTREQANAELSSRLATANRAHEELRIQLVGRLSGSEPTGGELGALARSLARASALSPPAAPATHPSAAADTPHGDTLQATPQDAGGLATGGREGEASVASTPGGAAQDDGAGSGLETQRQLQARLLSATNFYRRQATISHQPTPAIDDRLLPPPSCCSALPPNSILPPSHHFCTGSARTAPRRKA